MTLREAKQAETTPGEDRVARAALVTGGASERVATVLEERGWEFDLFDSTAELEGAERPAVVLLCADGKVASALAAELPPLREAQPEAPVVLVCAEVRPGELRGALAAGVNGVVLEEHLSATLGVCIEAVRAGQVCVPRRHAPQIEPATLSAREKQILGLVVMGYMNSEIAEQLFVAESTVKSHLSSAFSKLGVHSRNQAVELIVDPERGLGMGILALGGEPIESGGGA
ncbi:MAG TPA: response regulator transcription factor [Solirubrobacterales bacterium]|nr:response regulator transcription factor [Solirubrobacterales bacterium]